MLMIDAINAMNKTPEFAPVASNTRVSKNKEGKPKKYRPDTLILMRKVDLLRKQGLNGVEISEQLNVSYAVVKGIFKRLGGCSDIKKEQTRQLNESITRHFNEGISIKDSAYLLKVAYSTVWLNRKKLGLVC